MSAQKSLDVAQQAEQLYHQRLQNQLEQSDPEKFVAIEPVSGDYFLGQTLSEAIAAARRAHPQRLVHAVRVGHKTAVHLGGVTP